ncbi:MAG: hypothetical protein LCI00_21880 [Chloroflexi bacterium]|nr:hypothetical protein [Chloroflexota bacterium]MCC6894953.1 hypothetical protein [Anaerolineae bacterium]
MNADLFASIANIIGFTEADLAANRLSKLSDAQGQKLRTKRQGWLILAGVALILGIGLFARAVFDNALTSSEKLTIGILLCLAVAVGLLYIWLKWSQYATDLTQGIAAEGELALVTYIYRGNRVYLFRANGVKFRVDKVLYDLLTDRSNEFPSCVVYYAPQTRTLLALEAFNGRKYYKK